MGEPFEMSGLLNPLIHYLMLYLVQRRRAKDLEALKLQNVPSITLLVA